MDGVWDGKSLEKPVFKFVSGSEMSKIKGFLLYNYEPNEGDADEYTGDLSPKELFPLMRMTKTE